jgi:hypothetical protein
MGIKQKLFGDLDFEKIPPDADFKEAAVRAAIIDPLLKELGFTPESIIREKVLKSPFLKTGSKKCPVNLIPDYVLKIGGSYAWVLDAKSPRQKITNSDNVEQVYCYAAHPEIRSNYFALCNGLEFVCYRTTDSEKPVLYFHVAEIDDYWASLQKLLSSNSFHTGKTFSYEAAASGESGPAFDYLSRPPLKEMPVVKKQQAKRYFGCNAYFTRQAWDIVAAYIKNFHKKAM